MQLYFDFNIEKTKKCLTCKLVKSINDFASQGNGYKRGNCKKCYNSNWKYRILSTLSGKCITKNKKTKRKAGERIRNRFYKDKEINLSYLEELKNKQNGLCYWLKIPIDFTLQDKLRKPSLDRLDNTKGYEIDNIVLTTLFANTARRDATINEMKKFLSNYLSIHK